MAILVRGSMRHFRPRSQYCRDPGHTTGAPPGPLERALGRLTSLVGRGAIRDRLPGRAPPPIVAQHSPRRAEPDEQHRLPIAEALEHHRENKPQDVGWTRIT